MKIMKIGMINVALCALLVLSGCNEESIKDTATPTIKQKPMMDAAATPTIKQKSMTDAVKPTFVLIHSAWMGGWSWQHVGDGLKTNKYSYHAPDLPAHGNDKTPAGQVSLADYVNSVTSVIDKIDEPVILVGHSFGGVVASQVAEARSDKVDALVYLCALMLPDGVSFMDATKGQSDSAVLNNLEYSKDRSSVTIAEHALHKAVAHDLPMEEFIAATKSKLVAEPTRPLGEPLRLSQERFGKIPRYYIECTNDRAIPHKSQKAMYTELPVERIYSLASSHTPMFSAPDSVVVSLVDVANHLAAKQEKK